MAKIKYIMRDAWRLIWRHKGISFLTILTAMSVFYIIGASMLFILNIRHAVNMMDDNLSIQVYVKEGVKIESVAENIKHIGNIRKINIITKEDALVKLRERLGTQSDAVTLLGENPLPESIEILVGNARHISGIVRALTSVKGIDEIVYAGEVAKKLIRLSDFVERMSFVMFVIAVITSGLVLFNSIKIAIYSREREIYVMMRVGATPVYVALPFLIQGLILGLMGGICATGALAYSYSRAIECLKEMLPFLDFVESLRYLVRLGLMLVGTGTLVSFTASLLAVEKFIRQSTKPL